MFLLLPEKHEGDREEDMNNVFQLSEYVEESGDSNLPDSADTPDSPHNKLPSIEHINTAEAALTMIDLDTVNPDNSNANIQVVQYSPNEKTKRLGRPRKNPSQVSADLDAASENHERAAISIFRFDEKPVEGAGSRGGTTVPRPLPKGKITDLHKKKQKSVMDFFKKEDTEEESEEKEEANEEKNEKKVEAKVKVEEEQSSEQDAGKDTDKDSEQNTEKDGVTATEDTQESTPKKERKKPGPKPKPKPKRSLTGPSSAAKLQKVSTSRTTVINNRYKVTRQHPGPLLPLYYDLYDDNTIEAAENKACAAESIALGFNAKPSPFASDIVYIIAYLNKFKDVIYLGNIGPQDIEKGLNLNDEDEDVSKLMLDLYSQLLTLVLNRKNAVTTKGQGKAFSELKPMIPTLGLPKEWRDDSSVFDDVVTKVSDADRVPVDPSHPDIVMEEKIEYHLPLQVENPFGNKAFYENYGVNYISGKDRLVLLKCLMQWSFFASNEIKNYISKTTQAQDMAGEKDTSYGARSLLKGFKSTVELKKEIESKIAKRKATSNSESELVKYVDPTSDPLAHSMRLRLDELLVGDVGFHIGRFYLVRMADEKNGGLASIDEMKYTWSGQNQEITVPPSSFKFYAQDVHRLLTESLEDEGVTFDENGNDVTPKKEHSEQTYWYEVASNATELGAFIRHLEVRLGLSENIDQEILKTAIIYKPLLNLYNFLSSLHPLLVRQEETETLTGKDRSSRKKVNYNDVAPAAEDEDFEMHEEEDYVHEEEADDDDDYSE